jgi:hypothetical protein
LKSIKTSQGTKAGRIILNEKTEAENILSQPPAKYIYFKTLIIIAKYYFDKGYKTKRVKKLILEYCNSSPDFNLVLREQAIGNALKKARLSSLKSDDYRIPVTNEEVKKLRVLSHIDYGIAVYMLVIAKMKKLESAGSRPRRPRSFFVFFNYDIKAAYYNVMKKTISTKNAYAMSRRFVKAGVIEPTQEGCNHKILCADLRNTKDIAFVVDISKNILDQIVYYCEKCSSPIEKKSKMHDRCNECYKEKRLADKRDYWNNNY